jgi:hypothetical protein
MTMQRESERTQRLRADLMQALGTEAKTAQQIADRAGWSHTTVLRHLHAMQKAGRVHTPRWKNHVVAIWVAGPGRNVRRPPKVDKKAAAAAWRERNRDRVEEYQALANKRAKIERAAKLRTREHSPVGGMWAALAVPGK